MATTTLSYPRFRALDSNGDPLSGGKLYTYEAGTSTNKTSYTDFTKGTANANPVILDSNGEADVWLDGTYKLVLHNSADVQQWSVDNIASSPSDTILTGDFNLQPNGSFEADTDNDGEPDNWTISALSGGTVAIDATAQQHGLNSLKFTSTGSGGGTATSTDYYAVSASSKIPVNFAINASAADTHNKVEIQWYDKSQVFISTSTAYDDAATNPTSWIKKYAVVTSPATAVYAKTVLTGVAADSTTHGTCNFDDIEVRPHTHFSAVTGNVTATHTELNFTDGVTSAIQTQIDNTAGRRGALVSRTLSNQTLISGAAASISFDTEDYDTENTVGSETTTGIFVTASPTRLTTPTGVTKVRLTANAHFALNATGNRSIYITKNNVQMAGLGAAYEGATGATSGNIMNITSSIVETVAGDYFEVKAYQNSGGNLDLTPSITDHIWFAMDIIE